MRQTLLLTALLLVTASCGSSATAPPEPQAEPSAAYLPNELTCSAPDDFDTRMAMHYADDGAMWTVVSIQRVDVPAPVEYGQGEIAEQVHMVSYVREGGVQAVAIEATRETDVLLCAQDLDGDTQPGLEDIPFTCTLWGWAREGSAGPILHEAADIARRCAQERTP